MAEKEPVTNKGFTADWFMSGALTRIGDTIDRFLGRRWQPSSSLATSELIERLKKLLDAEAKEVPGKGTVVPHNIKLKMQWDKFSTDGDDGLTRLENELLIAAADHINDSLYYTLAPLQLKVTPDYFIEGVKLSVSFDDDSKEDQSDVELNVTMPSIVLVQPSSEKAAVTESVKYLARFAVKGAATESTLIFRPGVPLSVGRGGSSDLFLDDASVSKIHASLAVSGDSQLVVADTGSTNGTFINGRRISYGEATPFGSSDIVKFGVVDVVFEPIEQSSVETAIEVLESASSGELEFKSAEPHSRRPDTPVDETLEKPPAAVTPHAAADDEGGTSQ